MAKRVDAAQAASRGYKRAERVDSYMTRFQPELLDEHFQAPRREGADGRVNWSGKAQDLHRAEPV